MPLTIARNRDWNIGDKILLKGPIYGCDLEFTVCGIYDGPDTADLEMLWFHYQYLDETLKANRAEAAGLVGTIMIKCESASTLPETARQLEQRFASSDAPVRAMTEQAFQQMFTEMVGNVQGFIRNTAMAVVFSLVCVAGNAMAIVRSATARSSDTAANRARSADPGFAIVTSVIGANRADSSGGRNPSSQRA